MSGDCFPSIIQASELNIPCLAVINRFIGEKLKHRAAGSVQASRTNGGLNDTPF